MRIWLSGPRLLGGLIRPGISFNAGSISRRSQAASTSDFVYVIAGDHGLVKVGMTNNPPARLATLQTGSPHRLWLATTVPTFGNALTIEQEAHRILDRHRMSGEWFAVSPEMAVAAIYGGADRAGISLREATEAGQIREPRTSGDWVALIIIVMFGGGLVLSFFGYR